MVEAYLPYTRVSPADLHICTAILFLAALLGLRRYFRHRGEIACDLRLSDGSVLRVGLGKGLRHRKHIDRLRHPDVETADELVEARRQGRRESDGERRRWRRPVTDDP